MNKEYSAGAVIFKKFNEALFLVIYSKRNNNWGFPKGHIESDESEKDAVRREVSEETGINDITFVEGFREEDVYECTSNRGPYKGQKIEKHSIYYLCETKEEQIKTDDKEIGDFKWLNCKEAENQLTFDSMRNIFIKAALFLGIKPC